MAHKQDVKTFLMLPRKLFSQQITKLRLIKEEISGKDAKLKHAILNLLHQ